ncbi:MAG: CAP domain-containing protein [Bacteroides sp.]|nr:CAP domain-containing protein [Eubacterium sp.]MCM1417414.1 CAP domain-containing protein [Roseburia sp.]MCM1461593.1 CAP domain-containing protein [Bacteroides sp.]
MITGLSCCTFLSITLAAAAVVNRPNPVPVRFSDILEGASVTAADLGEDAPASEYTLDPEYLYETLYPTELLIEETTEPTHTTEPDDLAVGAGGTLLIYTTELTTTPPETEPTTRETTTERTTAPTTAERSSRTTMIRTTTAARTTTTAATAAPVTTTTRTAEETTTAKTAFTNIGGGVISNDDTVYLTMLSLVNQARRENGLDELWYSARVHEVSTLRAVELSSYYSHTRPNGEGFYTAFAEVGVSYRFAGENIAYGRNMFETPGEVFEAWMNSESHRENILNPDFECVAFGLTTLKVGANTYYYWSQEFAKF